MQRYFQLKNLSKGTYLIGVTGHIGISDHDKLKLQVRKILSEIKAKNHPKIAILCPGAEGGDQLVAEVAMEPEIDIPVIALRLVDYSWHAGVAKEFEKNQQWLDDYKSRVTEMFIDDPQYKNDLKALDQILNDKKRDDALKTIIHEMLGRLSSVIAGESDYIIALWDGVDNGKIGGTSETVHMALHGKDFRGKAICFAPAKKNILDLKGLGELRKRYKKPKGYLYQVVTPRSFNPFPIGRFPAKLIDNIPNVGKFETGVTIFPTTPFEGSKWRIFRKWQKQSPIRTSYLLSYWLPTFLALVTVIVGGFGFRQQAICACETRGWWPTLNDFFSAINLITFDSSKDLPDDPHFWALEIARLTGLLFVLNAFTIAVFIAIGKNNKIIGKVRTWRLFGLRYQIVVGLNDKSYHLVVDLLKKGKRVIVITKDADEVKITEAEKQGANVYIGNPYSLLSLRKIKAQHASKVYFLHDDDTLNIRSLNELDQLSSSVTNKIHLRKAERQKRYIHISDFRYKDFICISHPESDRSTTQVFNLYENTARRLMREYPIHRFNLNKTDQIAEVFVFGFGEMAEEIVLNSLRLGFYNQQRRIKITVFTNNHKEKQELFYKKYPVLWYDSVQNSTYHEKTYTSEIRKEIFPEDTLLFKELPMSDGAYFSDETIEDAIQAGSVVSLYFCTPLSVQSAAYLQAILPKIAQLQRCPESQQIVADIQCFCHYNLFDQDEVAYAEHVVNATIPNSAVIFFGSFVNECTERCFDHLTESKLPKLINLWYNLDRSKNEEGKRKSSAELLNEREEFWEKRKVLKNYRKPKLIEEAKEMWKSLSPMVKESNVHAAEHLWTKLYLMDTSFFELNALLNDQTKSLSEIAKQYAYSNENPIKALILEMAKVEHKRWCAERLLEGFLSFHDFYPDLISPEKFPETISKWNSSKDFKDYYHLQKQHLDLLTFDKLFVGKFNGKNYDEKVKDISLIEAIPYLIQQGFI